MKDLVADAPHRVIEQLRARIAQFEADNRALRDCGIQAQRTMLALEAEMQRLRAEVECPAPIGDARSKADCIASGKCGCNVAACAMRAEIALLKAEIAERDQRISEIAYNCPSCGRHDFGLWQPTVKLKNENDLLKAALQWALANVERLQRDGSLCLELHDGSFFYEAAPPQFAPLIAEAVGDEQ